MFFSFNNFFMVSSKSTFKNPSETSISRPHQKMAHNKKTSSQSPLASSSAPSEYPKSKGKQRRWLHIWLPKAQKEARLGIEQLGKTSINWLEETGALGLQFIQTFRLAFCPPYRWKLLFKQMEFIGNKSLGIVVLSGLFTGMVLTFQSYRSLREFGSESIVGGLVAVSMVRELGPVLSALMVNARAGSAIAAEVASMRVTEQIDALLAMAVNPIQYLITPRVLAGLIMMPMLTVIADLTGLMGSYLVGVLLLKVDPGIFVTKIRDFLSFSDILQGSFKAAVFGITLTQVGCFNGYHTHGGAEGVGRATTKAVVVSSVLILMFDYLITVFWQS